MTRSAFLFRRLWQDRRGAYSMVTAIMLPVLAGFTAFGTEAGLWFYNHQTMQSAADASAYSAAMSYFNGNTGYRAEATAVAARYGFVNGAGATVTVNKPPATGPNVATPDAIEVIVSQTQTRLFSAVLTSSTLNIKARAVAVSGLNGNGCVLSLDRTASVDISAKGTPDVTLTGCSMYDNSNSSTALTDSGNATITAQSISVVGGISGLNHITTTDGIKTGARPIGDPYSDVSVPSYSPTCTTPSGSTLNPGVYCGLTLQSTVTLNPGLYIIDGGPLQINAQANVSGSGVTIVLTSHTGTSYPTVTINGGATVNLSAANDNSTGPSGFTAMKGIVMYMDRNAPVGTAAKLNGGSTQVFNGALYMPTAATTFTGGSTTNSACLQLISDTIAFGGNANFAINCSTSGTRPIGGTVALVE